ncbi:MAG: carbamoyltransferase family protein [Hyphomicrobiaceae bacterium]
MNILGLVAKTHDTGIAIVEDGVPKIVFEEERFNRQKHTKDFPGRSLDMAFGPDGEFDFGDIDVITVPWDIVTLRRTFRQAVFGNAPQSFNLLRPAAHSTQDSAIVNIWLRLQIYLRYKMGVTKLPPIVHVPHHHAHAAVFFASPFEDASVLVMDGYGDSSATSAYTGTGNKLGQQWQTGFFDSLGMLYTCTTTYLGFKPFEEGTVMALAACGAPTYREKFKDLIHLMDDGRFRINTDYIGYNTHGLIKPFQQKFYDTFGPPRMPGEPLEDRHRDLAYALQAVTEDAVLHMARDLSKKHKSRNLVMTGGVALNCVANARVLNETDFERVWVPPVASDTGAPVGSALYHYHHTLGGERTYQMHHPFLGHKYSDAAIKTALARAGLKYEHMEEKDLLNRVAKDIADQKVVGWFQDRYEVGPRALGNRSILADPRSLEIKKVINARIKKREAFRPFAPAVLLDRADDFFETQQPDPFMTMAPRVRSDKVDVIPAAVHVDGTGRIQTVRREDNQRYYDVIKAFGDLTGVPVVINTSFNCHEPVVSSPDEAISCYLRTNMDVLVLGNYYIEQRTKAAEERAVQEFAELSARVAA